MRAHVHYRNALGTLTRVTPRTAATAGTYARYATGATYAWLATAADIRYEPPPKVTTLGDQTVEVGYVQYELS